MLMVTKLKQTKRKLLKVFTNCNIILLNILKGKRQKGASDARVKRNQTLQKTLQTKRLYL